MKIFVQSQEELVEDSNLTEIHNLFTVKVDSEVSELKDELVKELRETQKVLSYINKGKEIIREYKEEISKNDLFEKIITEINKQYKKGKLSRSYVLENIYDLVNNYEKISSNKLSIYYNKLLEIR